ncbi:MAG: dienelactone hydrolase family protein [Magnetococcales bacterium]|nr:dienelactone hydrolase family protein [Magnetococcales bacterium]
MGTIWRVVLVAWMVWIGGEAQAETKISGQAVTYTAQGVTLKGYLALDEARPGKLPAVLVVHEWWGLNDYARNRARMLAELGYAALAVDMYGDGRLAAHPDDAKGFSAALRQDFPTALARFEAAMGFLKTHPRVDAEQMAAIGYCFGGGMVLNMARQGLPLKGVASFHGGLDPMVQAQPGGIRAKILVLHGNDDPMIPPNKVAAFQEEMNKAGADYRFIGYPGATHAFTNPEADALAQRFKLSVAYHPEADQQSWQALKTFLATLFQAPPTGR